MSRIHVSGLGAVSPAGWSVAALQQALAAGQRLSIQHLDRPGWATPLRAHRVPAPLQRPPFLSHPRLRRASAITHYAAAAALEAIGPMRDDPEAPRCLGLVVCLQSGCVQYSYRFLDEATNSPSTASPLLFPETVFAAPASHVAALMANVGMVHTLLGDPSAFVQGLALAADAIEDQQVDACLVIGAEELNWLRADALWHLDHAAVISGGAGALCLARGTGPSDGVVLERITGVHAYSNRNNRSKAAQAMRQELGVHGANELLCDGLSGSPRADRPEREAWNDWPGTRMSPKRVLGEGLMAAAAWQCVAACGAVASGRHAAANVSVVGCNQQAMGVRFVRAAPLGQQA